VGLHADAYARVMQKKVRPIVAVLSNGEEDTKGTDVTRAANAALKAAHGSINYVGYCEGRDIMTGAIDVVVTDGFTGNVVLKDREGVGRGIKEGMEKRFRQSWLSRLAIPGGGQPAQRAARALGLPLGGPGRRCWASTAWAIVAHGKSDEVAMAMRCGWLGRTWSWV